LARELAVDNRTVLAAYRALEREGLVELRARSGVFFGPPSATTTAPGLTRQGQWALTVLLQGLERGTPVSEVPTVLARHSATVRLRGACIECNDDQIAALVAELSSDFGVDAKGYDVDALLADAGAASRLGESDLIVTTPFHAGEVQELAVRARVPWVAISYRADVFAEIARLLPSTSVYFVLTDERYAAKLGKIYAASPGADHLHLVLQGRDDVDAIPLGAPTYLSRTARERLAGHPILERVMPETRIFSAGSTREILTFIVRANALAMAGVGEAQAPSAR
ncbi:MAG: hypothetical protein ACR2OG_10705, partial [Gemmatimonadaceae bacterium]